MITTAGCGLCIKAVMVAEKDGCAETVLKEIFRFCGRDDYCVVPYGNPMPKQRVKSVLLLCGDIGDEDMSQWGVCVAERELAGRIAGVKKLITYSLARDDADFTARNIRMTPDGDAAFEIVGFGVIGRVRLKGGVISCVGEVLSAACAAVGAGIPFAEVLKALNELKTVKIMDDRTEYKL